MPNMATLPTIANALRNAVAQIAGVADVYVDGAELDFTLTNGQHFRAAIRQPNALPLGFHPQETR